METNYTVEYFINKFEAIPEANFCKFDYTDFNGKCCFVGHCLSYKALRQLLNKCVYKNGVLTYIPTKEEIETSFKEARCLALLFHPVAKKGIDVCYDINNGFHPDYQQKEIKQRILAALYDIRDKQLSEANLKAANEILQTELV